MAGETGPITISRRNGPYFWSMLAATLGILHAISGFLRYFAWAPIFLSIFVCSGWYTMVTGQSVVLISRLHLVTTNGR
ncbi:uncharacterized protein N7459_005791 [Penicillium hispanicum]|uniref:uncharacterized protein n=1 Tax=Penicillium hispanicum TaxID=1080232 RepID=UPI002541B98F|nr:uncharacterized protein N7459_005791 [Penicillium hispanicum]KAJ5579806.1 hypothetical protein N7459_005791 [Penicillium hispanicum]